MLRAVSSALVRERNVRRLLDEVIDILHREMGMLRGSITLLEGDELRIEASSRMLNAEERALGRYRIGEGITGLVAKTGRAEVIMDIRKDKRFLNRTKSRKVDEPLSYICVPLVHLGQVIGTLSVDREMRGDTTSLAHDLELLEIVANITAEAAAVCREECAEREALVEENRRLRDIVLSPNPGRLVGDCREMRAVYDRKRARRGRDTVALRPQGQAVRRSELRSSSRSACRIGAVRSREGRVHRCARAPHRPRRGGGRRHTFPGRDWRSFDSRSGQAAQVSSGAHVFARRF